MIGIYNIDEHNQGVCYTYSELHEHTFAPCGDRVVLDKLKGETYQDKKALLRDVAMAYSNMELPRMYQSDCANIMEWFERYGKRYGLLREFKENGIC